MVKREHFQTHAAFKCECLLAECHIGVVLSLHFLFCGQRGQKDHAAAGCKPQSCLHWGWWDCGHGTNEGLGTRMRWGFGGWQGGTKLPEAFPCRLGSTHLKDPRWRVKSDRVKACPSGISRSCALDIVQSRNHPWHWAHFPYTWGKQMMGVFLFCCCWRRWEVLFNEQRHVGTAFP